jgi:hypothetical protein
MSPPTQKKTPAKKAAAGTRRSPRAAKPAATPDPAHVTDADLRELIEDPSEEPLAPGEVRPVIIGKRGRRGDEAVQLVTIFEVDDVEYGIPKNPSAALVLSWLLDVQEMGVQQASGKLGLELLGEAPFAALKASPDLEPEDLRQIFENIGTVFFASENYRKIMAAPDPS